MKFLGKKSSESDSAIWLSNSDLMAGLMIIFLFISVGFIREKAPEIVGQQQYIMNYLSSIDNQENKILDALENEFTEDEKKNWNLEIIRDEQLIRFNAPDIMFNLNDDELTERYKKQFSAMESVVTSLKSTGDYLTNMMESWNSDK